MTSPKEQLKKIIWMIYADGFMQSNTFTVDKYMPQIINLFSEEYKDIGVNTEAEEREQAYEEYMKLSQTIREPEAIENTSQDGGWIDDLN